MRRVALVLVFGLVVPTAAIARTWQIPVDALGDAPSVQAGIDSATAGDTVLVCPGTYFECIDFQGKNVILRSARVDQMLGILDLGEGWPWSQLRAHLPTIRW
jgi:hypothetical protein